MIMIVCAADLNAIDSREQSKLVSQGTKILKRRAQAPRHRLHARQLARDRLEVDIVFEQDARNLTKLTRILAHRQILQLKHVNVLEQNLTMNQPFEVAVAEL